MLQKLKVFMCLHFTILNILKTINRFEFIENKLQTNEKQMKDFFKKLRERKKKISGC